MKVNLLHSISGNSAVFSRSVIEGDVALIHRSGYIIVKMVSAEYVAQARPFSNYCNRTECNKDVLNVTRDLCDGKEFCFIDVRNERFGYPCDNSYQYSLEVTYSCGKSSRDHKWKTLKKLNDEYCTSSLQKFTYYRSTFGCAKFVVNCFTVIL